LLIVSRYEEINQDATDCRFRCKNNQFEVVSEGLDAKKRPLLQRAALEWGRNADEYTVNNNQVGLLIESTVNKLNCLRVMLMSPAKQSCCVLRST